MPLREILTHPDLRLKVQAQRVSIVDARVRRLLDDMAETMYGAPGVGLAAVQVGAPVRAIVIDVAGREEPSCLHQLVNPEIVEREGSILWDEGCLSVPGMNAEVERSGHVLVRALDKEGKQIEVEAEGLLAVCLQHEMDHLDGVLFIDHLSRLERALLLRRYVNFLKERAEGTAEDAEEEASA